MIAYIDRCFPATIPGIALVLDTAMPRQLIALLTASLLLVSTSGYAASPKKVLLKVPLGYSSALPVLGTSIVWVKEQLELVSNRNIRMKLYEPGKLVSPFEILDAVSTGKVNAGYATAGYWAGKIPAAPLFSSVPFGPEAGEYLAWMYHRGGLQLYQEMYDQAGYQVHVIPCALLAPETSGWFAREINSPADLKGLQMRFFGYGGKVMSRLGVSTSMMPGGEIFPALEKKLLDATEFSQPAIDERLGFYKVVKYNYFPGWHQQATLLELLINNKAWGKMAASQQALIELTCKASITNSFAEGEAIQFEAMQRNKARGVEQRYWSPEMLALFRSTWDEVIAEESASDPFLKKAWDHLKAFRDGYQLWGRNAFLPRPVPTTPGGEVD